MTKQTVQAAELPARVQAALAHRGDTFLAWNWAQKAVAELVFYRGWLRHHTAAEGNYDGEWSHEDWRLYASALLRDVADGIEAGGLEPPVDGQVKGLLEEVALLQRKAQRLEGERLGVAAQAAYGIGR